MRIELDDLTAGEVVALLEDHLAEMRAHSPEDSMHALDLAGLRAPGVSFWSVWDGDRLAGCGALKELDPAHGEIKSMRTAPGYRGRGVGSMLLRHLVGIARDRGYSRLSLETGARPFYAPAHRLYERYGFRRCAPFADYREDPHSIFMTLSLDADR
ncbi:putative acetyltransferase [Nocardia transvalensis]|uniref:Putative acetyltransferase n=1 Tax=Nocardia transvalensis TaxID=37333 RepID=A0A7W9P891_9NOCA|nr:GNAT family N-acetyltransferase [Nocardia transvalensis]MBB5911321.1 putative acetyltransferase [Nocardia transvalensis]